MAQAATGAKAFSVLGSKNSASLWVWPPLPVSSLWLLPWCPPDTISVASAFFFSFQFTTLLLSLSLMIFKNHFLPSIAILSNMSSSAIGVKCPEVKDYALHTFCMVPTLGPDTSWVFNTWLQNDCVDNCYVFGNSRWTFYRYPTLKMLSFNSWSSPLHWISNLNLFLIEDAAPRST